MRKGQRLIVKRKIKAPGLELIELASLTVRHLNTSPLIPPDSTMDEISYGKAISSSTPTKTGANMDGLIQESKPILK